MFLFQVPIRSKMYYCAGITQQMEKEAGRNVVLRVQS